MGRVLVVARYARYLRNIYLQMSSAKFRALAHTRYQEVIDLRQTCGRCVSPAALEMCTVLPKLPLPAPLPDRAHNFSTEDTDTGCHNRLMAAILMIEGWKSFELICNKSHPNQQPRHPKHYPFIVHQKATLVLPWMLIELLGFWRHARWKVNLAETQHELCLEVVTNDNSLSQLHPDAKQQIKPEAHAWRRNCLDGSA